MKSNAHRHSRTDERVTREWKDYNYNNNNEHLTTTTVSELSQHEILFDWHLLWYNRELNSSETRFTNNKKRISKFINENCAKESNWAKQKKIEIEKKTRRHEQMNGKRNFKIWNLYENGWTGEGMKRKEIFDWYIFYDSKMLKGVTHHLFIDFQSGKYIPSLPIEALNTIWITDTKKAAQNERTRGDCDSIKFPSI